MNIDLSKKELMFRFMIIPDNHLGFIEMIPENVLLTGNHSPEKMSAVGAFLEANHHSIITHLITLDEKTLK